MSVRAQMEVVRGGGGGGVRAAGAAGAGWRAGGVLVLEGGAGLPRLARRLLPGAGPGGAGAGAQGAARLWLPERELETSWCAVEWRGRSVTVSPLSEHVCDATVLVLCGPYGTEPMCDTPVPLEDLKLCFLNRLVLPSNKLVYWHFGKKCEFAILKLQSASDQTVWYKLCHKTRWAYEDDKLKVKSDVLLGGYNNIVNEIEDLMLQTLVNNFRTVNIQQIQGILLFGHSGTGKTALCKYFIRRLGHYHVELNGSSIFSKYFGETESNLKKIFLDAINNEPSIIMVDEIDTICPKKGSNSTEQERRVSSTFVSLLDSIRENGKRVFILATTNKPDVVDSALRRFGRLDKEIEIPVPDKSSREEIMTCILQRIPNSIKYEDIVCICSLAHGYVAADIENLCTCAWMRCVARNINSEHVVDAEDLRWALSMVKASAMRELLVEVPDVKWSDIGGQRDLKLKLKQAVEWPLKHTNRFKELGIKPPSGVLMYGPPGCSKTMIAKALATESGLNFLSIKGPELFSKWVGESEKAVRNLFSKARQVAPSIIFFDEIDALGGERTGVGGGGGVHERVLAQLLTELDGVVPLAGVTVVAATNRPDKMDPALLRPGRIDRIVYVPLPDDETRREIFNIKLSRMRVSGCVAVDWLVKRTRGFSGAEVQAVCQEAALNALEENIDCVQVDDRHFQSVLNQFTARTPASLLNIYDKFSLTNRS